MRDLPAHEIAAAPLRMAAVALTSACVCKLVLCAPSDRPLIEAVGGYPPRLQSCVLAAWLRAGWQLTHARPPHRTAALPPPLAPLSLRPAVRLTRRIRFDDPLDPSLAGFLRNLPRKERGREVRHFILVALRGDALRTA